MDVDEHDEDDDDVETGSRLSKLNLDMDPKETALNPPNLQSIYMTTHKDVVTCTTFSKDGRYAASGSADTSLKILDVNKMKLMNDDAHPVIRTLYDHLTVRTEQDFFFWLLDWNGHLAWTLLRLLSAMTLPHDPWALETSLVRLD